MCSDFDDTSTTLLAMSDPEEGNFLVKGKEKIETTQILFHVSKATVNNNPHNVVSGSSSSTILEEEEEEEEDRHRQGKENGSKVINVPSLGGVGAAGNIEDDEEEESGFKTPTSLDHRLPEVTLCPGAPRKPKFRVSSRKRKLASGNSNSSASSSSPSPSPSSTPPPPSSSGVRRGLLLDLSQEVESLFPRPILADTHRERKRARSGGGGGGDNY